MDKHDEAPAAAAGLRGVEGYMTASLLDPLQQLTAKHQARPNNLTIIPITASHSILPTSPRVLIDSTSTSLVGTSL
jgi:NADH dehydrogenase FAD-containing subunit